MPHSIIHKIYVLSSIGRGENSKEKRAVGALFLCILVCFLDSFFFYSSSFKLFFAEDVVDVSAILFSVVYFDFKKWNNTYWEALHDVLSQICSHTFCKI